VAAGAEVERPAADAPYGRTAVVRDPAGHRWMLQSPAAAAVAGSAGPSDVAYVTVAVPDAAVARAFYGAVLGWEFAPGSVEDGWSAEGTSPSVGLWGGQPAAQVQLCYRVRDLGRALAAVRTGGGEAQEPEVKPYGRLAECTDPAGLRFQLWEG
jgi:predicted enzyme related to lactoylglutathione lyase